MLSLSKGIFSNFVSKTLIAGLGLLTVILVSQRLGAAGRGSISLFMSGVALLQLFCDFGNSSAIINLSYTHSQKNLSYSSQLWVLGVCLSAYLFLPFFRHVSFVFLIPPAAFLFSYINLNHLLLMGQRKVGLRNLSSIMQPLLLLCFFWFMGDYAKVEDDQYIICLFFALLLSAWFAYSLSHKGFKSDDSKSVFETEILKKGFWVQSGQAIQFLNYRVNFFLIPYFIGVSALGVFNNAVILSESIWILGHSIGQMQHMRILNTEGHIEKRTLSNKMILINLIGTTVLTMILIAIPNSFWVYLFSKDFESMRELFPYLAPGVIVFSVSNIINHHLHAEGHFKTILICNL
ncbi:MAG TPA: oligosaccharide flippase family protein, partial [Bacteroidia bacterium]